MKETEELEFQREQNMLWVLKREEMHREEWTDDCLRQVIELSQQAVSGNDIGVGSRNVGNENFQLNNIQWPPFSLSEFLFSSSTTPDSTSSVSHPLHQDLSTPGHQVNNSERSREEDHDSVNSNTDSNDKSTHDTERNTRKMKLRHAIHRLHSLEARLQGVEHLLSGWISSVTNCKKQHPSSSDIFAVCNTTDAGVGGGSESNSCDSNRDNTI